MRRSKRGGFTIIELVFALVIIAIVGTVSADVIMRVYEQYVFSRDFERGQNDTRRTLDIIAARLQYRIKNSAVGRRPGVGGDSILSLNHENIDTNYPILEWVGISYESQRATDADGRAGWSGAAYKTSTSGFHLARSNLTTAWATESEMIGTPLHACTSWTDGDSSDCSVFVFAGSDLRGDYFGDQNSSWGWSAGTDTYSYFRILPNAGVLDQNITLATYDAGGLWDNVPPSAKGTERLTNYYIARSAYALMIEKAAVTDESGDLVLYYDYRPWLGERYDGGRRAVMLRDVTNFLFKEQGSVVRLVLCVLPSEMVAGVADPAERRESQFCREKVVL